MPGRLWSVSRARVRRRTGALLAVALGVAAAGAAGAAVLAASPLSLVSRQSAMERSLRAAPPAERAVRVTVLRDGLAGGAFSSLDATVRDGMRGSAFAPGVAARAVRFGGPPVGRTSVVLTGADSPGRWVVLRSGRLPRACSARECEVVAVGGARVRREFALEGTRMRVVGVGRLDGVPLGAVPPGRGSVDSAAAFVVAPGVETVAGLLPLRKLPRTFAWARVLDPALVHPWSADRLFGEMLDARTALLSTLSSAQVRVPSDRIAAEQARGRAAGAFALVIAGLAATVLLAFAACAAAEQHAEPSSIDGDFANGVLSYSIAGVSGSLAVRAPQPSAPDVVPVLATPGLARQAAADGRLPLRLIGADLRRVQVVGVVEHVPTAGPGEAVVADVGRLFAALNSQYPGLGTISERWTVGDPAPGGGRELRLAALARQAAADPLSRGVLRGLWGLALLGGLVALAAMALAVASAARDRGGEQAELEAIGVPPRSLRAQMVATAAITAIAGLLAGVCGGAALAGAFTGLVALGADGRSPLPELIPAFPWPLAVALAVAAAAIAIAFASAQARRAFRGDALGRLRA